MQHWTTFSTQHAYRQGVQAAKPILEACEDACAPDCPYDEDTAEFAAWHDGLQDGADDVVADIAQRAATQSMQSAPLG